jgi:hypothetical protein
MGNQVEQVKVQSNRKLDVSEQLKAEIDGAEITKVHKFALQQKYGLSGVLDTDIEWYLQEVLTRG